jgi:hypothetical protein
MLVHNKGADGKNKKVLKELKREKTKNNIWHCYGIYYNTIDFYHTLNIPNVLSILFFAILIYSSLISMPIYLKIIYGIMRLD